MDLLLDDEWLWEKTEREGFRYHWGLQEYILLIRWWWHWWEQYIRSYFLNRGCPKRCSILNCNMLKSITQISTRDTTLQAHHTTHNSTPYEHAHTMLYWTCLEWNCTQVTFNQSQPTHKQKRRVRRPKQRARGTWAHSRMGNKKIIFN